MRSSAAGESLAGTPRRVSTARRTAAGQPPVSRCSSAATAGSAPPVSSASSVAVSSTSKASCDAGDLQDLPLPSEPLDGEREARRGTRRRGAGAPEPAGRAPRSSGSRPPTPRSRGRRRARAPGRGEARSGRVSQISAAKPRPRPASSSPRARTRAAPYGVRRVDGESRHAQPERVGDAAREVASETSSGDAVYQAQFRSARPGREERRLAESRAGDDARQAAPGRVVEDARQPRGAGAAAPGHPAGGA